MIPRQVRYHPEVASDLASALDHYRAVDDRVAERFVSDYRAVLDFIEWYPQAGAPWLGEMRKKSLSRYPYFVGTSQRAMARS